jgi:hypothetical protein
MKPLAVISLTIRTRKGQRGRKKLEVFIWKHLKDLRQAAKEVTGHGGWKDTAGCYIALRAPGRFGQIHLCQKWMGAGYWAHEQQHFMYDYSEETEVYPLDQKANERMAFLAGDLTAQFWIRFYECFEVKPGMNQ